MLVKSINNTSPSTYSLTLLRPVNRLTVYDSRNRVYFYRDLPFGLRVVKVNIPDKGNYTISEPAIVERKPLQIIGNVNRITFPPKQRHREKDYYFTYDPNETSSPALIYTHTGQIVRGAKFKNLSKPMQIFILLHELGHFHYETEEYCDLYALYHFIKMGYNPSTAMYCLLDELRRNPANNKRIEFLFNTLRSAEIVR